MSDPICAHGVSLKLDCLRCREHSRWRVPGGPRWCRTMLRGGPFDGDAFEGWWEGQPYEIRRTTVPSEESSFVRVYLYRWADVREHAVLAEMYEVPRCARQARRMRDALGISEAEEAE